MQTNLIYNMKILKFNENSNKIYICYKVYGGEYNPIDDIFNDLEIFDNLNVKYYIRSITKRNNIYIGVYAQVTGDFELINLPSDYRNSASFNNISELEEYMKIIYKNIIQKEDIIPLIQANKFNL